MLVGSTRRVPRRFAGQGRDVPSGSSVNRIGRGLGMSLGLDPGAHAPRIYADAASRTAESGMK